MPYNWGKGAQGAATGAMAGSSFGPWGTAIGGAAGALGGFGSDPEDEAKKYLDQIPEALRPYFEKYINAGNRGLEGAEGHYNEMANDPGGLLSKLGAGYKQSPGYQFRLNQGEQGITNAAAANGMAGSNMHQQNAGELAGNLANQDYQNYLNSVMGLYGSGVQGQQTLANNGQNAGQEYGNTIGNNLMSKAGLGYAGQANRNQNQSDFMSSIMAYLQNQNKQ